MSLKDYKGQLFGTGIAILLLCLLLVPTISVVADEMQTTSTIGGIEITETEESEIQRVLATAIAEWKNHPLIVTGAASNIALSTDLIHFDIQQTVKVFLQESKAPWYMPWKRNKLVHLPLLVEGTEELDQVLMDNPLIYVEETRDAVLEHARYLKTDEVVAKEREVTKDFMDRIAFEIQPTPQSTTSLSALVTMLDGFVLPTKEAFSFLEATEEMTGSVDIESRRFFASVLYSVILQAETSILERHSQHQLPDYLQPGIEVDVSHRLQKDFAFQNDSGSPMLFNARIDDGNLVIELYMLKDAKEVSYSVVETEVEPKTIYRLSPTLNSNQTRRVNAGENGYSVTVYRTIYDGLGEVEATISKDFYPPVHEVIEVSAKAEPLPNADDKKDESEETNENNSTGERYSNDHNDKESRPTDDGATHDDTHGDEGDDNDGSSQQSPNDSGEVIYDKGGDVIYDPNA